MKKNFAAVAVCALLLGPMVGQCQSVTAPEPRNVVQLAASASMDVAQDWLSVTLGTTREGSDPTAVQDQLRRALESALAEAKKAAKAGAMDVHTGQFSLQPRYGNEGKINGWQGSAALVLEGKDFARIGATAGKLQPLTISSTSFSLSPEGRAKVESQVQAMAIERFRAKAGDIASGFGFKGYSLREVSVNLSDAGQDPRPRAMMAYAKGASADAPIPVEAGTTAVVVQVNGSVQLN
jgi:predicted secreted protein